MSTTVKTGWLKDNNGEKFAPKTLSSQVQTSDGVMFEDKIQADLDSLKSEIINNISIEVDTALSSTSTNPVQNNVINAEFEAISIAMNALDVSIDSKLNSSDYVVDSALSDTSNNPVQNNIIKTEFDTIKTAITAITTAEIDEICGAESFSYDESGNVSVLSIFNDSTVTHDGNGNVIIS